MIIPGLLESWKDSKPRPSYGYSMGLEPTETCHGKLKLGIVLAPGSETVIPGVLNFAAYIAGFPRAEKVALATGKRSLGRRKILTELCSCRGTMAVDTSRFFGRVREFRWCGPGQDEFPRNGLLLHWLNQRVREDVMAPFGKHHRYLILWHSLPLLPAGMTAEQVRLREVLFSLGRIAENYAEFVAIHRNGRLDFLKNRAGSTFPQESWRM